MKARKVWICIYNHRHGTDCAVYTSQVGAMRGACATMLDNLHEVNHVSLRNEIRGLVRDGKYSEALDQYETVSRDESFEVAERSVEGTLRHTDLTLKRETADEEEDEDEEEDAHERAHEAGSATLVPRDDCAQCKEERVGAEYETRPVEDRTKGTKP